MTTPASAATSAAPAPGVPPRRRRRWPLVVLAIALPLAVAVAAAPWIAAPFVRSAVERAAGQELDGSLQLSSLSLGWGTARTTGVRLADSAGRTVLSVAELDVNADLAAALGGRYEADVVLSGLQLDLRRGAQGGLNLAEVLRQPSPGMGDRGSGPLPVPVPRRPRSGEPTPRPDPPAPPPELSALRARVELREIAIVAHADDGSQTRVEVDTLTCVLDGLHQPLQLDLQGRLSGTHAAEGRFSLSTVVRPGGAGLTDVATLGAELDLQLEQILLAALQPLLALLDGPPGLRGLLHGGGQLVWQAPGSVQGNFALSLRDAGLAAAGPAATELVFPDVELSARGAVDDTGSGEQQLRLQAGELVSLDWTGRSTDLRGSAAGTTGELQLTADLERVLLFARPFLTELPPALAASGTLHLHARPRLQFAGAELRTGELVMEARIDEPVFTDAAGVPIFLGELSQPKLQVEARVDMAAGTARLSTLALDAGPLQAGASGEAGWTAAADGSVAAGSLALAGAQLALDCDLDRLAAVVAPWLGESAPGASGQLALQVQLTGRDALQWQLQAPALTVRLPDGRSVVQRNLEVTADCQADLSAGLTAIALRKLELRSHTAHLALSGTLAGLDRPSEASADLQVQATTRLEQLFADLSALLPPPDGRLAGGVDLSATLAGHQGALRFDATTTLTGLQVDVPGEPPLAVREERVLLRSRADLTMTAESTRVDLAALELDSTIVAGRATGTLLLPAANADGSPAPLTVQALQGDFRYWPARLGALAAPFVKEVTLVGAAPVPFGFRVDGEWSGGEPLLAASGLDLALDFGLGQIALPGVQLGGTLRAASAQGLLDLNSDLTVNGGTVKLQARGDLRALAGAAPSRSAPHVSLALADVNAGAHFAQVLGLVSPLLVMPITEGSFSTRLGAQLSLDWDGPLTLAQLAQGPAALPLQSLSGGGQFALNETRLSASPLLGEMLAGFGASSEQRLEFEPLSFTVAQGRIDYSEPWVFEIGGVPTSFRGGVGLDGKLDLVWDLPLTERLLAKHPALGKAGLTSLAVPLRGTLDAPRLRFDDALQDALKEAVRAEFEDRVRDGIGDKLGDQLGGELGGLLGGVLGGSGTPPSVPPVAPPSPPPGGTPPPAPSPGTPVDPATIQDPAKLLALADEWWAAERKPEARPLYRRLKDEFKLTTVYLFNKSRIEERAKPPKPPKPPK